MRYRGGVDFVGELGHVSASACTPFLTAQRRLSWVPSKEKEGKGHGLTAACPSRSWLQCASDTSAPRLRRSFLCLSSAFAVVAMI